MQEGFRIEDSETSQILTDIKSEKIKERGHLLYNMELTANYPVLHT